MNPTMGPSGKWQWLPTDFDGTFGSGATFSRLPSYKNWYDMSSEGPCLLVSKLILQNQQINGTFEQILKELTATAFKPEAFDFNNNLNHRIKGMTAGVIPWVTQMSALVANKLGCRSPRVSSTGSLCLPRVRAALIITTTRTKTVSMETSLSASEALLRPVRAYKLACLPSPYYLPLSWPKILLLDPSHL
ncbi:hypothetical protein EC957_003666 [Mortierella hygrophila]|uniref:Uncharacterized protein n=1 Tax=Mortierella hygrophila TaxID=979708 RepID=A0A9P6F2I7_9FUNG|nr:hypothetical protein EC957_003666 [Mortierella hygrophila]